MLYYVHIFISIDILFLFVCIVLSCIVCMVLCNFEMFREDRKGMPGKCCSIIQNVVMMDVHYYKNTGATAAGRAHYCTVLAHYWPTQHS